VRRVSFDCGLCQRFGKGLVPIVVLLWVAIVVAIAIATSAARKSSYSPFDTA